MSIRVRHALTFVFVLASAGALAEDKPNPRAALVIGNAKYESSIGPLRNPVNDAKAVARTLRELGFKVVEGHNLTRDELLKSVVKFRANLAGAEVALFYYAGHGISVAGSNYLIPIKSGYNPEGADDGTLRMLAETKLFNAEQVVAEMSAAGARCNLVILDACRSTPVARSLRNRDIAKPGGLTEMTPPAGSMIAFATDAGHTANDGEGANGLYTGELLKHLRTPGLTIEQVFKRTRAGVMELSDGKQVPAEYSRLVGEDIYLAGPAPEPPVAGPVMPDAPPKALKAERVIPPTSAELGKLAAAGKVEECIEGIRLTVSSRGAGDHAAAPLDRLLEFAKETLKDHNSPSPEVATAMRICDLVLDAMNDCLPADHPDKPELTAKAQNRRGDCLLILGRAEEALAAYNVAIPLVPNDAYPVYNRGRAQLALGRTAEARADFTSASSSRFKQPMARRLSLEALAELPQEP
jgi:Caspase domain